MSKRTLFASLLLGLLSWAAGPCLQAQSFTDSLRTATVAEDSPYTSIFSLLAKKGPYQNQVVLEQDPALTEAVTRLAERNIDNKNKLQGYRIRIFFDNGQNARQQSEKTMADFQAAWPDVPVYRAYANPYFKVTVGDFRTKSEALHFMSRLLPTYPRAFLTREPIAWPRL